MGFLLHPTGSQISMFTIRLVDKHSGKPVRHTKVFIEFSMSWLEERMDDSGRATFDVSARSGTVMVHGRKMHSGHLQGEVPIYV